MPSTVSAFSPAEDIFDAEMGPVILASVTAPFAMTGEVTALTAILLVVTAPS